MGFNSGFKGLKTIIVKARRETEIFRMWKSWNVEWSMHRNFLRHHGVWFCSFNPCLQCMRERRNDRK